MGGVFSGSPLIIIQLNIIKLDWILAEAFRLRFRDLAGKSDLMNLGKVKTTLCIPRLDTSMQEVKLRLNLLDGQQFDHLRFNIEKALRLRQKGKPLPKWLSKALSKTGKNQEFNINQLEMLLLHIGHQGSSNSPSKLPEDYRRIEKLLLKSGYTSDALKQLHLSLYRKTLCRVRKKLAVQELLAAAIGESYFVSLVAQNPRYLKCDEILNWIHHQRVKTNRDQLDRLLGALKSDKRKRPPKSDVWRFWLAKRSLQLEVRSIREADGHLQSSAARKLVKRFGQDVGNCVYDRTISESEVVNMLLQSQIGDSRHMENQIAKLNSAINRMNFSNDEMDLITSWNNVGFRDWPMIASTNFWPDLESLYWSYLL